MPLTRGEILPAKKNFASELGTGLQKGIGDYFAEKQQSRLMEQQMQQKQKQSFQDQLMDEESYKKVSETFGEKFADVWKSAPQGGKTELLKMGIEAKQRGINLDELLKGAESPMQNQESQEIEKPVQMKEGKIPKDYKWPDFSTRPPGYTPKDWINEKGNWRKENSPIFDENKKKLVNHKKDEIATNKLDKLNESKKLPEGLERLIIDPSTGDIRGAAQLAGLANEETQEWVKEIARFQNKAKDAFGSRVTNFDLMSYMKQFPGLLNTYGGRSRIIQMMKINNKLDQLYEKALQSVYQKYGLSGIPQEEADKLAQSLIEEETEQLANQYLGLQDEEEKGLSGKMIDVKGPDGQVYEVDQSEVENLPQGFMVI